MVLQKAEMRLRMMEHMIQHTPRQTTTPHSDLSHELSIQVSITSLQTSSRLVYIATQCVALCTGTPIQSGPSPHLDIPIEVAAIQT